LPIAVEHLPHAVSVQDRDAGSTLQFYRDMLAFRKAHGALRKGDMTIVSSAEDAISFLRADDGVEIFCAFNLSDTARDVDLPEGEWVIDDSAPFHTTPTARGVHLPAWQACFALRQQDQN
jgi:alpha-glucosidase